MNAGSERNMAVASPCNFEPFWIGKHFRISICRADHAHHSLVLQKLLPRKLRVLSDPPKHTLHRVVPAKRLLDCVRHPRRVLDLLIAFNQQVRRSNAQAKRQFAEGRAAEFGDSLKQAEEALETFYSRNRTYRQSPQLVFQETRLQRQISIQQELYLNMRREAETAKLEEVNDAPVLTIVDPPEVPARPSWPKRGVFLLLGGVLGLVAALARVLVDPHLKQASDGELDALELQAAWTTATAEWRGLLRRRP